VTQEAQPRPFNEKAALAELERLADKIRSSRQQREQAEAQFEAFVRGFREQNLKGAIAAHAGELAARAAAPQTTAPKPPEVPVPRPVEGPVPRALEGTVPSMLEGSAPTPAPTGPETIAAKPLLPSPVAAASSETWEIHENQELMPAAKPARSGRAWIGLAAVGVALLLVVLWRPWRGAGDGAATPVPRAEAPAPAAATPSTPPPTPQPPAPANPVPARALNVELTTLRPVWTRVTVDDRRVIERELAAGQRIPLGADRSIVIRAGDAGAVRLTVDGKDLGVLGRDGQIGTRTLTAK
jgi:Domain of unknown function (DUF4115)